jgi:hypothetical protein
MIVWMGGDTGLGCRMDDGRWRCSEVVLLLLHVIDVYGNPSLEERGEGENGVIGSMLKMLKATGDVP